MNSYLSLCRDVIIPGLFEEIPSAGVLGVILIGSFSKNEGTVYKNDEGKSVYLSDMEFIVAVKEKSDSRKFNKNAGRISRKLTDLSRQREKGPDIDLGFTVTDNFKKWKPNIFTYEVKNYAQVVWGDEKIMDHIPDYPRTDIPKFESLVILFNRAIEQLKTLIGKDNLSPEEGTYALCKGYVNLVLSQFIFQGDYQPTYGEAMKALDTLEDREIREKGKYWLRFKLNPEESKLVMDPGILNEEIEVLRGLYTRAWIKQSRDFLKTETDDFDELARSYFRTESLGEKIKGWVKLFISAREDFSCKRFCSLGTAASPRLLSWLCGMGVYLKK